MIFDSGAAWDLMDIDVRNVNSSGGDGDGGKRSSTFSQIFLLLFIPLTSNKYQPNTHNCNAIKLNGCNKFINQEAKAEEKTPRWDDFEWEKLRRVLSCSFSFSLRFALMLHTTYAKKKKNGNERESQDDTIRSFIIVFYRGWEHTLYTHTEWGQIKVKT